MIWSAYNVPKNNYSSKNSIFLLAILFLFPFLFAIFLIVLSVFLWTWFKMLFQNCFNSKPKIPGKNAVNLNCFWVSAALLAVLSFPENVEKGFCSLGSWLVWCLTKGASLAFYLDGFWQISKELIRVLHLSHGGPKRVQKGLLRREQRASTRRQRAFTALRFGHPTFA